jgi:ABC-type uncharacterized transport system permease subunit
MPLLWLRVAVGFYAVGLLYALTLLNRQGEKFARIIVPAVSMGMVFQFVSLVEAALVERVTFASIHYSESLLAFIIMFLFMVVRVRYKTTSPGIFVFPLVFLLSFASAIAQQPHAFTSTPLMRSGWLFVHIALIFTGYAALFLSFGASLLYILQAKTLKAKKKPAGGGMMSRLPALQVIDDIGYKSLLLGFPFMTLGLVAGAVVAQNKYGPAYFHDPKVVLSMLMWAVYVLLLYVRWNAGWRGRRAAYLGTFAFVAAMSAWVANFFSRVHRLTP